MNMFYIHCHCFVMILHCFVDYHSPNIISSRHQTWEPKVGSKSSTSQFHSYRGTLWSSQTHWATCVNLPYKIQGNNANKAIIIIYLKQFLPCWPHEKALQIPPQRCGCHRPDQHPPPWSGPTKPGADKTALHCILLTSNKCSQIASCQEDIIPNKQGLPTGHHK